MSGFKKKIFISFINAGALLTLGFLQKHYDLLYSCKQGFQVGIDVTIKVDRLLVGMSLVYVHTMLL